MATSASRHLPARHASALTLTSRPTKRLQSVIIRSDWNRPVFARTELQLGRTGQTFVIAAPRAGKYIVAAKLNGQPLERAWLRHAEIAGGGVLEFELADQPGNWATRQLPPSPGTAG